MGRLHAARPGSSVGAAAAMRSLLRVAVAVVVAEHAPAGSETDVRDAYTADSAARLARCRPECSNQVEPSHTRACRPMTAAVATAADAGPARPGASSDLPQARSCLVCPARPVRVPVAVARSTFRAAAVGAAHRRPAHCQRQARRPIGVKRPCTAAELRAQMSDVRLARQWDAKAMRRAADPGPEDLQGGRATGDSPAEVGRSLE